MNTLSITDKDLLLIEDCVKAVKAINFDTDKYNRLLSKIKPCKDSIDKNISKINSQLDDKSVWGCEYLNKVEFCNNCQTHNLHTHKHTSKKCCACCGAC